MGKSTNLKSTHFMGQFTQTILRLLQSKLSRRVASWVFLSLILIEGIILVPTYQNRRRELLSQLEQVSRELLAATKQNMMMGMEMDTLLQDFGGQLKPDSVIKGLALYDDQGKLISTYGEIPSLMPEPGENPERAIYRSPDGKRYDVAWSGERLNYGYILVIRHDSSRLHPQLIAYVFRILGLVLLIAIVVTVSTMWVVGAFIIVPFLKLRQDFIVAGETITGNLAEPQFQTLSLNCQDEMGEVFHGFHQMFQHIRQEVQQRQEAEIALRSEQEKSEQLLLNVLPGPIAQQLKQGERAIAQSFEQVTILFADLVNFTCLANQISAHELVCLLNDIFSRFDALAQQYQLEKIKTIGDAYMVVAGVPTPRPDHGEAMAQMALAMQRSLHQFNQDQGQTFQLRIGINTGPVVAGVIGTQKFAYDLWGDAVNLASRMESHSLPGKIQVTTATYQLLEDRYQFEPRGLIQVKGRGEMETYFLLKAKENLNNGPSNPFTISELKVG
jgi:class 3 adenylate cyclase